MSVVAVSVCVAAVEGLAATMLALGLAVLLLDLLSARVVSRCAPSLSRHRLAAGLVLLAAAVAGAATTVHVGTPTGAPLLLLIPAFRAGEVYGRPAAALCVLTAVTVSLGTAAMSGDLGPALEAGWLQWGGLALLGGMLGAWSASVHRSSVQHPSAPATDEPPAAHEAAVLLRRLDTLAGALDGGFDAPASAELLLDAVDAAVPSRRRGVLVGFGHDPAVPLALRGTDRVPWPDPALAAPGPAGSLLGRVWRSGTAERGEMQVDGETRPLLAAALRDPMGDRIGVVVLERSPGAAFDDADVRRVVELAEAHSPNLDASLIFAALRERAGFEERERLAREMHDGIAQELVALGFRVDRLKRLPDEDLRPEIVQLRTEVSRILGDVRSHIGDLRLTVRPEGGLGAAITSQLQVFGAATGAAVTLRLSESSFRLPAHVETGLYRIFLDFVADARRAAQTEEIEVEVSLRTQAPDARMVLRQSGTTRLTESELSPHLPASLGAVVTVTGSSSGTEISVHLTAVPDASAVLDERLPQPS
jgi:signal transduction histidine kinase